MSIILGPSHFPHANHDPGYNPLTEAENLGVRYYREGKPYELLPSQDEAFKAIYESATHVRGIVVKWYRRGWKKAQSATVV